MGETYNPIGPTNDYENGFFSPIPIPPPGYANVLTGGQNAGHPLVIQSRDIPRKEQIRQGKYCWITQIDIQPHRISFEAELPANDNISHFHLAADMTACVDRPELVCLDNLTDVAAAVKSSLLPELQARAIQYSMDDIQQLRTDIGNWLKDTFNLDFRIQLTNIRVRLEPDQAYIARKTQLRREDEDRTDRLRKLQEQKEYETQRARVADALSREYSSDMTQTFAELASGDISPEDAARRIEARRKKQSVESFDEKMRQMKEVVELVKMMQDSGMGSPDTLAQKADQLLGALIGPSSPALNGGSPAVQALEGHSSEQTDDGDYAPPADD